MTAREFNETHRVGQSVRYHSVIGDPAFVETRTRSLAATLANGQPVVLVEGRTGYVALEAISDFDQDSPAGLIER